MFNFPHFQSFCRCHAILLLHWRSEIFRSAFLRRKTWLWTVMHISTWTCHWWKCQAMISFKYFICDYIIPGMSDSAEWIWRWPGLFTLATMGQSYENIVCFCLQSLKRWGWCGHPWRLGTWGSLWTVMEQVRELRTWYWDRHCHQIRPKSHMIWGRHPSARAVKWRRCHAHLWQQPITWLLSLSLTQ